MNYLVRFVYDPGTPKNYLVLGAPSSREARKAALAEIGYHPGVDIIVRESAGQPSDQIVDYVVEYKPLSSEMKELILYND